MLIRSLVFEFVTEHVSRVLLLGALISKCAAWESACEQSFELTVSCKRGIQMGRTQWPHHGRAPGLATLKLAEGLWKQATREPGKAVVTWAGDYTKFCHHTSLNGSTCVGHPWMWVRTVTVTATRIQESGTTRGSCWGWVTLSPRASGSPLNRRAVEEQIAS